MRVVGRGPRGRGGRRDGGAEELTLGMALRVLAATVVAFTAFVALPRLLHAESVRQQARRQLDAMAPRWAEVVRHPAGLDRVRDDLERATRVDPSNGQAWADLAYAESLRGLAEGLPGTVQGRRVEGDARRAIGICPIAPEFWVRLGTGLDMQGRWPEGGEAFSHALVLAPSRAEFWYYQAYHLSLGPNDDELALSAADIALRLDPGFTLAQSLRQRLASGAQAAP